ncbi:MAG: response regulator containing a CheY-like receiver domain and an DNA-binding domain [Segetibacter sp.]|nr:response regulator containing a CheY-like receiver domain and an DNA-binding domain [Segetibacter sp.]
MKLNMQFIIIDDEEINLFIHKRIITVTLGITNIKTFTCAAETLRFLQNDFKVDMSAATIILLDLNMPGVSGWDFLEFFDQFDSAIKNAVHIYIVTSSIDPIDRKKALLNNNVIALISKPITKEFLIEYFNSDNLNI